MLHISGKTKVLTFAAAIAFLLAGFIRVFNWGEYDISDFPVACLPSIIYVTLIIGWIVAVNYRIIQANIRRYLTVASAMMVFWFVIRETKYHFFPEHEFLLRHLWYLYYIPMLFLPAIIFIVSLAIGNSDRKILKNKWNVVFIPAFILFFFVLTNDMHQLIFKFNPNFYDWDRDYSHGRMYALIMIWISGMILCSLVILVHKCAILAIKRSVWIPIILFFICSAYLIYTISPDFIYGEKLFQMQEMFCLMIVAISESSIQLGLIPSNLGYEDFFNTSTVNAQLADTAGFIRYKSENVEKLSLKDQRRCVDSAVLLDENTRLNSYRIRGGRVFWTDDLTIINRINRDISDIRVKLSHYNDILKTEAEMKKRNARASEKNRLYDGIAREIKPQLDTLMGVLDDISLEDSDIKQKFSLACILNAYIKRRSNLSIVADTSEIMDSFELVSSIRESVEYLNVYGMCCTFIWNGEGKYLSDKVILAYEFFESIVENILDINNELLVNLKANTDNFVLKFSIENIGHVIDENWQKDKFSRLGASFDVSYEDETVFITFFSSGREDIK